MIIYMPNISCLHGRRSWPSRAETQQGGSLGGRDGSQRQQSSLGPAVEAMVDDTRQISQIKARQLAMQDTKILINSCHLH